jgi:putative NADPH-quinone reductase
MHTLIITANPRIEGLSHKIADTYMKAHKAVGNTCEILNLYTDPLRQKFLEFQDIAVPGKDPHRKTIQDKILKADRIVFAFPLWWYEAPAILRNFIEVNFTSGFAFKFGKTGIIGLLKPKEVQLFVSTGGPKWLYSLGLFPLARSFRRTLKDCGFTNTAKVVFGANRDKTPNEINAWLKVVEKIAKK